MPSAVTLIGRYKILVGSLGRTLNLMYDMDQEIKALKLREAELEREVSLLQDEVAAAEARQREEDLYP